MTMSGMPLPLAVMITIPEPWKNNRTISQEKYDFYQYYATMMEPWDGPASILFSDGDIMGAVLDRNGLRPSRYCLTSDGFLILSSETGCIDIPPEKIIAGRILFISSPKASQYTVSSRASILSALPVIVFISPLCTISLLGWAFCQLG